MAPYTRIVSGNRLAAADAALCVVARGGAAYVAVTESTTRIREFLRANTYPVQTTSGKDELFVLQQKNHFPTRLLA